jgi:hypothetical protein
MRRQLPNMDYSTYTPILHASYPSYMGHALWQDLCHSRTLTSEGMLCVCADLFFPQIQVDLPTEYCA